jgi:hypothetical protein
MAACAVFHRMAASGAAVHVALRLVARECFVATSFGIANNRNVPHPDHEGGCDALLEQLPLLIAQRLR